MQNEQRKFFRHPVDIPIHIFPQQLQASECVPMCDISAGGIAIQTNVFFEKGARLKVCIPHIHPPFEAIGIVRWHRSLDDRLEIGLMFPDTETTFRIRMVEQICQIEKYRNQLLNKGHVISFQKAASQWIEKYAGDFGNN